MPAIDIYRGSTEVDVTFDARAYETVSFYCTALQAAVEVVVEVAVSGAWEPYGVLDAAGVAYEPVLFTSATGTPASVQMFTGPGQLYRFTCGDLGDDWILQAIPGPYLNS